MKPTFHLLPLLNRSSKPWCHILRAAGPTQDATVEHPKYVTLLMLSLQHEFDCFYWAIWPSGMDNFGWEATMCSFSPASLLFGAKSTLGQNTTNLHSSATYIYARNPEKSRMTYLQAGQTQLARTLGEGFRQRRLQLVTCWRPLRIKGFLLKSL